MSRLDMASSGEPQFVAVARFIGDDSPDEAVLDRVPSHGRDQCETSYEKGEDAGRPN